MKKYELWIIDDDKDRIRQYKDFLKLENLQNKIKIKRFDVLMDAYNKEGTPDFILIDTTSIMGGITIYGCFDTAVSLCRGFANKHISSVFCIQSAVKRWAKDIIEEFAEQLGQEVVIDSIQADATEFINWIKKWIKLFESKGESK